jgi:uncharacterized protein (TIRG00374 family)
MTPAEAYTAGPRPVRSGELAMPDELAGHALRKRLLIAAGLMAAIVAAIVLLPGLEQLRTRLAGARPEWLLIGVALKLASGLSYVLVFRSVFCPRMRWRVSYEVGMAELGANALLPTGGAGGLALGAWALRRAGMETNVIARRTVAFFLLTSVANVVGVMLIGIGLAVGIFPGHAALALCLVPAAAAAALIVATLGIGAAAGRLHRGMLERHGTTARRVQVLAAIADGVWEAVAMLRRHDWQLVAGAIGYLAFDVMVLWATFHAFGSSPQLAIIWIAYLIGELGGLIPVPGGIGGVDVGLVGMLVVYGVGLAPATAAVLAYRAIALWVPAVIGFGAFLALRRTLRDEAQQLAECVPGTAIDAVGLGPVVVAGPDR